MSEILQANVFFFIASIATVIFCILVCLILYQVLKMAKSMRSIVERIELESEKIAEDVTNVRNAIAQGGIFGKFFQFIMGVKGTGDKKRRRTTKK